MRFNHPPLRVRQIALVTLCLAVMLLSSGRRPHGESRLVSATSLESHRPRPLNTFRNGLLAANEAAARLDVVPTSDLERKLTLFKSQSQTKPSLDNSQLIATFEGELTARHRSDEEAQKHTLSYKRWANVGKYLDIDTPSYFDPSAAK